jgi:hypothetical protein
MIRVPMHDEDHLEVEREIDNGGIDQVVFKQPMFCAQ